MTKFEQRSGVGTPCIQPFKRTEYATYLLHKWMEYKVANTLCTGITVVARVRREAIKEHSNVKSEHLLFTAGEPRTP